MSALIYGIRLQFRMDIRSRTLLVTCICSFFAVMAKSLLMMPKQKIL